MVETSYKNIFKTTFLFGFVTVARLLVSIVKNKIIAVLLGPQGVGMFSVFNNTTNLIKTGAGLGISQSAVKDVSEANNTGDIEKISQSIVVTQKIVLFTSLIGLVLTLSLSPLLSKWGFNDYDHIGAFVFLSIAIFFEIYVENQLAILKGMRKLKAIAIVSLIGSMAALVVGVPFIYIMGNDGIVPSIIASAMAVFAFSYYYVSKIGYLRIRFSVKEIIKKATSMIQMGTAMMVSNFLFYLSNLIIIGYIQKYGGLVDVGLYNAGSVLAVSYISVVTSSMNTDYFPRIAAINSKDDEISKEIYKQSVVSLVLLVPLVLFFVLSLHFVIGFLYTREFDIVTTYIDVAVVGVLISAVSNCFGYVFIAKQEAKFYFWSSVILSVTSIPVYMLLYRLNGLFGLGLSYTLNVIAQLVLYVYYCWKKYSIRINVSIFLDLLLVSILIYFVSLLREMDITTVCIGGITLLLLSFAYIFLNLKYRIKYNFSHLLSFFKK